MCVFVSVCSASVCVVCPMCVCVASVCACVCVSPCAQCVFVSVCMCLFVCAQCVCGAGAGGSLTRQVIRVMHRPLRRSNGQHTKILGLHI